MRESIQEMKKEVEAIRKIQTEGIWEMENLDN